MDKRDEQEAIFEAITQHAEKMDGIIDSELQPKLDPRDPNGSIRLEGLNSLEADIAEVGMWLANYQRTRNPKYKALISHNEREFRETLARFKALNLTNEERRLVKVLEALFNKTVSSTRKVIALEEDIHAQSNKVIQLRGQIDLLLDNEIQPLAIEDLYKVRREADEISVSVVRWILWLIPFFVLSATCISLLLIRSIRQAVTELRKGTQAISRGDLTHRMAATRRDEFGELADTFNGMVDRLEATTVSKDRLEASQAKLQETVTELRREIGERKKAEEEQARLQASLRRSELLSVMGSLVAAVAHEVRNPLFAISSTVDAFEARFSERQEYQRYLSVL
jgi:methyl-accepting chemotaxis protein